MECGTAAGDRGWRLLFFAPETTIPLPIPIPTRLTSIGHR
jgi:hypothetical protein